MAKKETENELTSNSNDLKEPLIPQTEKNDDNFRVPTISSKYRSVQTKIKRYRRNKICPEIIFDKELPKSRKSSRHKKKKVDIEIASDKNIATLLRSERLLDFIKKGCKIPYEIGRNISKKTGFKSVSDLNDYISAHRKKFIVLVDRKEKHCQNESNKCNNLRRTDSVDLDLYFAHHYGEPEEKSTV